MAYVSKWGIIQMAESALTSYEITADWKDACNAAIEFAADEWEIKATQAQAVTAVCVAKTAWQGIKQSTAKVINHPQY